MINAILTKEITVQTADSLGVAAKVTHLLAEQAKTNIRSAYASSHDSKGYFYLITDNNEKALQTLKKDYPNSKEEEVLVFYVPDSIGKIEEVTQKISEAGLNINYLYTTYFENKPAIVLSTNDNVKTLNLFKH